MAVESLIKQTNQLVISEIAWCWSEQVRSIFMTHQVNIQMPQGYRWLSKAVKYFNHRLLKKFSTVWIPDYPDKDNNLSGELSAFDKMGHSRFVHIGPLSRFHHVKEAKCEYDVACILSGPEPQRSIFEEKVVRQLKSQGCDMLLCVACWERPAARSRTQSAF